MGKRGRPRRRLPEGIKKPNAFARWLAAAEDRHPMKIALILGVSRTTIYDWRRGKHLPGRKTSVRIAHLSDGAVAVDSWDRID